MKYDEHINNCCCPGETNWDKIHCKTRVVILDMNFNDFSSSINIIHTQSQVSVSKWYSYMKFSLLVLYLLLSRGNNFFIFFKIKQNIGSNKAITSEFYFENNMTQIKNQRWELKVKNFVGSDAVSSCPGETFLYDILRQCFFWSLSVLTYHFCLLNEFQTTNAWAKRSQMAFPSG